MFNSSKSILDFKGHFLKTAQYTKQCYLIELTDFHESVLYVMNIKQSSSKDFGLKVLALLVSNYNIFKFMRPNTLKH